MSSETTDSRRPSNWDVIRRKTLRRDQYRCQNSDCRATAASRPSIDLQVHHRLPVEHGGDHSDNNLITVCNMCHQSLHRLESDSENKTLDVDEIGAPSRVRDPTFRNESLPMTNSRESIVDAIEGEKGIRFGEIVERSGRSEGNVSSELEVLRIAGWVKKEGRGLYSYVSEEEVARENVKRSEE